MLERIKRMKKELEKLEAKLYKLDDFIGTIEFEETDEFDRHLMVMQLSAMKQYRHILSLRITGLKDD